MLFASGAVVSETSTLKFTITHDISGFDAEMFISDASFYRRHTLCSLNTIYAGGIYISDTSQFRSVSSTYLRNTLSDMFTHCSVNNPRCEGIAYKIDWKSGMGMRIKDVLLGYEDPICPPTIKVWREVSFQRLLAGAFLFMFYIASKMYDALNARKIKVMENEQDNCNKNCKAKQEIQNINEKCWYPETHEIKRNTFNEPCNLFAVYEQEANESDAIRAKKHTILEREEARLMHLVMCKICLDADACVVFLPCSHMVACGVCACFLEKCPVCRAKIVEFLQVNLN